MECNAKQRVLLAFRAIRVKLINFINQIFTALASEVVLLNADVV